MPTRRPATRDATTSLLPTHVQACEENASLQPGGLPNRAPKELSDETIAEQMLDMQPLKVALARKW